MIWKVEIFLEVYAHPASEANSNIAIAAEVAIDLNGEGKDDKPPVRCAL